MRNTGKGREGGEDRERGKERRDEGERTHLVNVLLIRFRTTRELLRSGDGDALVEGDGVLGFIIALKTTPGEKQKKTESAQRVRKRSRDGANDLRPCEGSLHARRDLLEYAVVLPLSDAHFDECVPILLVKEILIHRLDHGVDVFLFERSSKTDLVSVCYRGKWEADGEEHSRLRPCA